MKKSQLTDFELHSAGATVRHKSIFDELDSHELDGPLESEFIENWVKPFYSDLNKSDEAKIALFANAVPKITDDIISKNLGEFNWRTRATGSYFAAITNAHHFTDIIGIHLLKSEVCYAGKFYAVTLASFNNEKSPMYLNKYLRYYLQHPELELEFDQGTVLAALLYLDEKNGTNHLQDHIETWKSIRQTSYEKLKIAKGQLDLEKFPGALEAYTKMLDNFQMDVSSSSIHQAIDTIEKIKNRAGRVNV